MFDLNCEDAKAKEILSVYYDELGKTLGEELITPTKIKIQEKPIEIILSRIIKT